MSDDVYATPRIFETKDVSQAVALADKLKADGSYQFFRGQADASWELKPSLARLSGSARVVALQRLARFTEWLLSSEEAHPYVVSNDHILAIAQHYGFATLLLDFTTQPSVAGFFAASSQKPGTSASISMINAKEFGSITELWNSAYENEMVRILEVDVSNLWRLQAQHGLFVEAHASLEFVYPPDKIVFPHAPALKQIDRALIYPDRKSHLELCIDNYLHLQAAEEGLREIAFHDDGRPRVPVVEVKSMMPAFPHASTGHFGSWPEDPVWMHVPDERWEDIVTKIASPAPSMAVEDLSDAGKLLSIIESRRTHPDLVTLVGGDLCLVSQHALDRLWNGMRMLPYSPLQIASAIEGLHRIRNVFRGVDTELGGDWTPYASQLYGDAIEIELSTRNDLSTRAFVEVAALNAILVPAFVDSIGAGHPLTESDLVQLLLKYYSIPRQIFQYGGMVELFARQIIPWQVATGRDLLIFSPWLADIYGIP